MDIKSFIALGPEDVAHPLSKLSISRCECYKTFISSSQMKRPNKPYGLSLASTISLV
jgi:hypothetical protein